MEIRKIEITRTKITRIKITKRNKHNTNINENTIKLLIIHVLGITYIYLYLESNIDYLLYQLLYTVLYSSSVHDL